MVIRIGIVGTGGMARQHARHFSAIRGVRLTACQDIDLDRAKAFAEENGVKHAVETLDDLLEEVDAVSVVASDAAHAALSLQVLAAGKHLLCEKPLTISLGEARKVARAFSRAREQGVIGMTNFSHRGAHFDKAVKMVQQGELGELRYVRGHYLQGWLAGLGGWDLPQRIWRLQTQRGSGGVLHDLGCHLLDFITGVCGPIKQLRCTTRNHAKRDEKGRRVTRHKGIPLDANDTATIELDFANGGYGHCHTTRWAGGKRNDLLLEVHGTEGALSLGHQDPARPFMQMCIGDAMKRFEWQDVELPPLTSNWQRFAKAIRTGKPEQPDILRGAQIQSFLEACERSAAIRDWTRLRKWT